MPTKASNSSNTVWIPFQTRSTLKPATMNHRQRPSASTIAGTIEHGPRGPLLLDGDGVRWRLGFPTGQIPDGLSGRVNVRGRIVEIDRIEVDYLEGET